MPSYLIRTQGISLFGVKQGCSLTISACFYGNIPTIHAIYYILIRGNKHTLYRGYNPNLEPNQSELESNFLIMPTRPVYMNVQRFNKKRYRQLSIISFNLVFLQSFATSSRWLSKSTICLYCSFSNRTAAVCKVFSSTVCLQTKK